MKISVAYPVEWEQLERSVSAYNSLYTPKVRLASLNNVDDLAQIDLIIQKFLVPYISDIVSPPDSSSQRTLMIEDVIDRLNEIRFLLQDDQADKPT